MTTTELPQPARSPTPGVHHYQVSPGAGGSVLALFTGSRADEAVAARAAELAARTGRPVVAAAVVRSTGFSVNALLHRVRARRMAAESDAVLTAVRPVIARAGPVETTALVVPARVNPYRSLPVGRVGRLAARTGADLALTPVPLTGHASPVTRRPGRRAHAAANRGYTRAAGL